MNSEKVFRTKSGYCHVLEDKIVLTRDGIVGNIADVTVGNSIARPLIIYGLITIAFFLLAIKSINQGQILPALLFIILGLLLALGILKSLNNSATPVIDRDQIKQIEFKKAVPGATRAYFIVHFKNKNGQLKRRLIMLPGSLSGGQSETEKALQIMTEEFG